MEDVVELLYDCESKINGLEIFNLEDYAAGMKGDITGVSLLQQAINLRNVIPLLRLSRIIISRLDSSEDPHEKERIDKLSISREPMEGLKSFSLFTYRI